MDSLARLKLVLDRDIAEPVELIGEVLQACTDGIVLSDDAEEQAGFVWEAEPTRSMSDKERMRCILELSAADSYARLLTMRGFPEDARGSANLRDQRIVKLLGASNLDSASSSPPKPQTVAFLNAWWSTVDSLLSSGMVTAAEVLARVLDGVGRRVLGASHPSTLHMTHLLIQSLRFQGRLEEVTPLAFEAEALWRKRATELFKQEPDAVTDTAEADGERGADGTSGPALLAHERRDTASQLFIATATLLSLLGRTDCEAPSHMVAGAQVELGARVASWLSKGFGRAGGERGVGGGSGSGAAGSLNDTMAMAMDDSLRAHVVKDS